jgi:hypothetical protein
MFSLGTTIGTIVRYYKTYFTSRPVPDVSVDKRWEWGRYEARLSRYNVYWAHYENSAYDNVHIWSQSYKADNGLYRYTRGIYNPTKRLVDFWGTHLMGGTVDPKAGDGKEDPSCLPILTDNLDLRAAIAVLWRDSDWQLRKEMYCRIGPALGDVALRVCDDPDDGRVTIEVVHPGTIQWALFDDYDCVIAYRIRERRFQPDFKPQDMTPGVNPDDRRTVVDYVEDCWLDDATGTVHYKTYLNNTPYAWNGVASSWDEPYGFVPLVIHPHARLDPKTHWGWPEIHPGHSKVRNLDDLAATLHDQIRKAVRPKWFFSGMQNPNGTGRGNLAMTSGSRAATTDNPEPEREELAAIYAGIGATAYPMVFQLDIQFTSVEISNALSDLERDYPELRFDRLRATGDASAKALREARKPAEAKVHAVRAGYDNSLVMIQKMAIVIGAFRGYAGYEPLAGITDLRDPKLDHRIGPRSVFNMDPLDIIEEEQALWTVVATAVQSNIAPETVLERCDWDEEQIARMKAARASNDQVNLGLLQQQTDINVAAQAEIAKNNAEAAATVAAAQPQPAGAAP